MNEERIGLVGQSGLSEEEVLAAWQKYQNAPDGMSFSEDVLFWDEEKVKECREILYELVEAGKAVGHPCTCNLRAIEQTRYTEHLRVYSSQSLVLYHDALIQVRDKLGMVCALLGLEAPKSEKALEDIAKFCAIMIESKHIPSAWVFSPRYPNFLEEFDQIIASHKVMVSCRERLLEKWSVRLFELNGIELWSNWEIGHTKNFFKKKHVESQMQKKLAPYACVAVDLSDIASCLRTLNTYQQHETRLHQLTAKYAEELSGIDQKENTDFIAFEKYLSRAKRMDKELNSVNGYPMLQRLRQEDIKRLQVFFGTWRTFSEVQGAVYKLFAVNREKLEPSDNYVELDIQMCNMWRSEIHHLKDWVRFNAAAAAAYERGMGRIVYLYENGLPHEWVLPSFEKAYYSALLYECTP